MGRAFSVRLDADEAATTTTARNDVVRLDASKLRRTPQGGLRGPAALSRVGVFPYRHRTGPKAGQIVMEYRPAEEVFHPDSLATLEQCPITEGHPVAPESAGLLTAENFTKHARGQTTQVTHDNVLVHADALVQDGGVAKRVLSGHLRSISPGYTSREDWTSGLFQGQHYDLVQRDIRYNHIALLPPGGGRQGSDVALRFDAAIVQEDPPMIIKLDGKEYDMATEEGRAAFEAANKAKFDAVESERDAAIAELTPLKTEKAAAARAVLEGNARKVLKQPEAKFDGKSDREVMVEALALDCTGKDDAYVVGRFDAAVEAPVAPVVATAPDATMEAARNAMLSADPTVPEVTTNPGLQRWKEPLTASKDR